MPFAPGQPAAQNTIGLPPACGTRNEHRSNGTRTIRATRLAMMASLAALVVAVATWPPAAAGQASVPRRLLAGASVSNITPPLGELIVGNWTPAPATHVHDELHARSLVLDNGESRLAIVVADNLGIPRRVLDEAKRIASAHAAIPTDRILISSTHTHSATDAHGTDRFDTSAPLTAYQTFLAQRIADGIRRAANNLEPAQIGWGRGTLPDQVFNRRWFMKSGPELANPFGGTDRVRMNPPVGSPALLDPAGPTDPEISFLAIASTSGRPIALLANYSLHYVGGVPNGHISADYFGYFAGRITRLLEAEHQEPPFVAMLSNGTSGDINNIDFRGGQERLPPYGRMELVANQVAAEVFKALQVLEYHPWVALGAVQEELALETRKPTAEQVRWAQATAAPSEHPASAHPRASIYADRILRMRQLPPQTHVALQAMRIGDLAIAAIPFEVFVEIGLELKARSPFSRTFVISLANGAHGYLPTVHHHELGGYETWLGTNLVEVQAAPKIVDRLVDLLNRLH